MWTGVRCSENAGEGMLAACRVRKGFSEKARRICQMLAGTPEERCSR